MDAAFLWPWALWLLGLVPGLALAYRRARRRAPAGPVTFPHVGVLAEAAGHARPARQHLAVVLFLAALALVVTALARPQMPLPVPTDRSAIVLAIDISGSMRSTVAALPGRGRPDSDGTLVARPSGPLPPGLVILLSDGRSNTGIDAVQAAAIARQQEVAVYTVGVGQPQAPDNAWTIGGPLDEAELQAVAREAGGKYFRATSAEGLRETYERLARTVGWERRPQEVTGVVGLLGGLALVAALAVSGLLTHQLGVP